jgi:hypothetical protein
VEAVLDMGAAGVVEGLLRCIARTPRHPERLIYETQVYLFVSFFRV